MMKIRTLVIFSLFSAAGYVLIFVGLRLILDFPSNASMPLEPARRVQFLVIVSAFVLAAFALLRLAVKWLIIWAAKHEHRHVLNFFQWIAPRFSRRILSSILSTSIALSTAVAANADTIIPAQSLLSTPHTDSRSMPESVESSQRSVPNAQWFPEQISVPLNRLISSGAQPKHKTEKTITEVVVAQGENLWSIAATHLGPQATAEEISAYWPQVYQANRQVIGSDPNVLEVGTVLVLPHRE